MSNPKDMSFEEYTEYYGLQLESMSNSSYITVREYADVFDLTKHEVLQLINERRLFSPDYGIGFGKSMDDPENASIERDLAFLWAWDEGWIPADGEKKGTEKHKSRVAGLETNTRTENSNVEQSHKSNDRDRGKKTVNQHLITIRTGDKKWSDILITSIADEKEILVQIFNGKDYGIDNDSTSRTCQQAGFTNVNTGKPKKSWGLLMDFLNSDSGSMPSHPVENSKVAIFQKKIQRLRGDISRLFPDIKGKPIKYDENTKEYRIAFLNRHLRLHNILT